MEHQRNESDKFPLSHGQSENGTHDVHIIDMQRSDNVSSSSSHREPDSPQEVDDSNGIDPPNNQNYVASMSRANSNRLPVTRRSEEQNHHLRSPLNLRLWIPIELFVTICQLIALLVVLLNSRHEKPRRYLFVWVVGYTSGCIAALPVLCWQYHNIKHMIQQDANRSNHNESSNSPPPVDNQALDVSSTVEDENQRMMVSTSTSSQANEISSLRISSYMTGALDCFFAVWFLLGNICLFGDYASSVDSPHLYKLCLIFIILSYIGYVMPFILCATICCFLPCIVSAIESQEDQYQTRGASLESINALKTFKFKLKGNNHDQDFDNGPEEAYALASQTDTHGTQREESACCICLTEFEDDEEMRELPCLHFFHVECIDTWLKVNATCPLCKFELGLSDGGSSPMQNSNHHNS